MSPEEKMEIIRIVEDSPLGVKRTLKELQINRSTFYRWYGRYKQQGFEGLRDKPPERKHYWNKIPEEVSSQIIDLALEYPEKSSRQIAVNYTQEYRYYVSESSVYRILKAKGLVAPPAYDTVKAADEFEDKTERVNQLWQTDFTYLKVSRWGWYYLSTILDDYSRYIVSWKLCKTMQTEDVKATIDQAYASYTIAREERPNLLSDNGSCYIAKDLKTYLGFMGMGHIHGAACHPQTQGKIERYHRSMKSLLLLDNHTSPEELEAKIHSWVEYYNHERAHEALDNLTPADVYLGRAEQKLKEREQIKRLTMMKRRNLYQKNKVLLNHKSS